MEWGESDEAILNHYRDKFSIVAGQLGLGNADLEDLLSDFPSKFAKTVFTRMSFNQHYSHQLDAAIEGIKGVSRGQRRSLKLALIDRQGINISSSVYDFLRSEKVLKIYDDYCNAHAK